MGPSDSYADVTLQNTIVASNRDGLDQPDDIYLTAGGAINSGSIFNLIGFDPNGYFPSGNDNQIGTVAPIDPLLAPLGRCGGSTPTHVILPGSPAIEGGFSTGNFVDQRGYDRWGVPDIGTTEFSLRHDPVAGTLEVYGTDEADEITVGDGKVDISTIPGFSYSIPSGVTEIAVYGLKGDDIIFGSDRITQIHGGDGNDFLVVDAAFVGDVDIYGESGHDQIWGGSGNDALHGGNGNDKLYGGAGDDSLYGNAGIDYLDGGDGFDTTSGGTGKDSGVSDPDDTTNAEFDPIATKTYRADLGWVIQIVADDATEYPLTPSNVVVKRGGQVVSDSRYDAYGDVFIWHEGSNEPSGTYTVTMEIDGETESFNFNLTGYNAHPPDLDASRWYRVLAVTDAFGSTSYYTRSIGSYFYDALSSSEVDDIVIGTDAQSIASPTATGPLVVNGKLHYDYENYHSQAHRTLVTVKDDGSPSSAFRSRSYEFLIHVPELVDNLVYTRTLYFPPAAYTDGVSTSLDTPVRFSLDPGNDDGYRGIAYHSPQNNIHATVEMTGLTNGYLTQLVGEEDGECDYEFTPSPKGEGLASISWNYNAPTKIDLEFEYGTWVPTSASNRQDSNIGKYYFEVGKTVRADIDIDRTAYSPDATQSVSAWHTCDPDLDVGDDVPAFFDFAVNGEDSTADAPQSDLVPVRLGYWLRSDAKKEDFVAKLTVTANDVIKVWTTETREEGTQIDLFGPSRGGDSILLANLPPRVWVEGLTGSDVSLDLQISSVSNGSLFTNMQMPTDVMHSAHGSSQYYVGHIGGKVPMAGVLDVDSVRFVQLDLDIDSDNEDGFALPDRSDWEEELEDHTYGLGKLIMLDSPTRPVTPLIFDIPANLDPNDPNIRIRVDWDPTSPAGWVRLWDTSVIDANRNPAAIDEGGNRIYPGFDYSLDDLNYDPQTGTIIIYAEGTQENPEIKQLAGVVENGKPQEFIRATFVANGVDLGFDEVKYIVANEDSFFYALQNNQALRNTRASRGAYLTQTTDLPDFSLRPMERAELIRLGVAPGVANLMIDKASGISGYNAVMYQDYITGPLQYALAFGGTEYNTWENVWNDWVNNIEQARGAFADQYEAAQQIGEELSQVGTLQNRTVLTGHSLGGGLASAAAIIGGYVADTYNAAGLHESTLYRRDGAGNLVPDGLGGYVQIVPGSLGRYNSASLYVDAYWVDYDILTFVQLFVPPQAAGHRPPLELDSPYDLQMHANAALLGAAIGSGQFWSAAGSGLVGLATMIDAHRLHSVLYGFLVTEGTFGVEVDMLGIDAYYCVR